MESPARKASERPKEWRSLPGRIDWIIKKASGQSANLLTERAGFSKGYFGRLPKKLLRGSDVGTMLLKKFCAVTLTNECWLFTGYGWPRDEYRDVYRGPEPDGEPPPRPTVPGQSDIVERNPLAELPPLPRMPRRRRKKV